MELIVGFLAILLLAAFGAIAFLAFRKQGGGTDLLLIQQELQHLRQNFDDRVGLLTKDVRETMEQRLTESSKTLRDTERVIAEQLAGVGREVAQSREASKQVFQVAESLQNLEKVLTNQKNRGTLGEAGLELVLANILPPDAYSLQCKIADGLHVDAAIRTPDGLIPVDAKFSLDSYMRMVDAGDDQTRTMWEKRVREDLKLRIDETSKYISPQNGTLPFAFMFIPAEAIYYDLFVGRVGQNASDRSLLDYAYREKSVIVVSPTTFAAYLQSVLYGFRAFKIEESTKIIAKRVDDLKRHLKGYEDAFQKMGGHLDKTVGSYNTATKQFLLIDKDIERITGEGADLEALPVGKIDRE
jgi:DNA recombination protein RmuC